jgi:hypothetical protein
VGASAILVDFSVEFADKISLEMVNRAICLGRTPGIKQADINEAFWAAAEKTNNITLWE